jgi:iron complex transport system substrate-binding protein
VDDVGATITLPKVATRIVTIAPSNTEIALELGLKSEIVGTDATTFEYAPAPWSHELKGLHDIGPSYPGVSVEQIIATKPDLVIAIPGVKGLSSLARFHIPVLILYPETVQGIYHDIQLVGQATGRSHQATEVVNHLRSQMSQLQSLVKTESHHSPTVFYDLGELYTAGPDSYINILLTMAGSKNVTDTFSHSAYPQVTPEQVVKANPQMIIYDPSGASVPVVDALPGFSHITAVKDHDVVSLPQHSYVNEPSPAVAMGLYELIHLIHPHLRIPHDLVKNL